MLERLEHFGQRGIAKLRVVGQSGIFLIQILSRWPDFRNFWQVCRSQLYFSGVLSCLIIFVSALFIGMVVGLQGFHTLEKFGATTQLGQLLALSITRELGPVISALLFAGRACSAMTAELGLMKSTEQLASMEMMGVDPISRVVYPRFMAALVALPVLSILFSVTAIFGGYLIGVVWLGIDDGSFWSNMQMGVDFRLDVVSGIIKSLVFAVAVVWIAVYEGMICKPTAEGICQATTRTVVYASLSVLGLDFLLTAMMIGGW